MISVVEIIKAIRRRAALYIAIHPMRVQKNTAMQKILIIWNLGNDAEMEPPQQHSFNFGVTSTGRFYNNLGKGGRSQYESKRAFQSDRKIIYVGGGNGK